MANGYSNVNSFQELLFSAEGLDWDTQHTVVVRNAYTTSNPSYVDIDWIDVATGDGDPT